MASAMATYPPQILMKIKVITTKIVKRRLAKKTKLSMMMMEIKMDFLLGYQLMKEKKKMLFWKLSISAKLLRKFSIK